MSEPKPLSNAAPPRAPMPGRLRGVVLLAAGLTVLAPAIAAVFAPADRVAATTPAAVPLPPSPPPVRIASAERLQRLFERLGYELEAVAEGAARVPQIQLAALPPDLGDLTPVDRRKALFIRAVLPIVIGVNRAVLAERADLESLRAVVAAGGELLPEQEHRFRRAATRYGLPDIAPDADGFRRLLRRVDAVPVSMAVAQAISESGWGTSRFAIEGNALFGQWTWDEAAGILPAARRSGETHRVRSFRSLADSARAYLYNLNTHPAYAGLRKARAAARGDRGSLPAGEDLAEHLGRYSERGAAYVEDIVTLIRQNRLDRLDGAPLGEGLQIAAVAEAPTGTDG